MKQLLILVLSLQFFVANLYAQVLPTPTDVPNKICYDYDVAGNRIAQKGAWVLPEYGIIDNITGDFVDFKKCTCNLDIKSGPFVSKIIRIKDLNWLSDIRRRFVNIVFILDVADFPRDFIGNVDIATPTSGDDVIPFLPDDVVGVVIDINDVLGRSGSLDRIGRRTVQNKETASVVDGLELTIAPNPTEGKFQVMQKGFNPAESTIYIYDQKAQLLFERDYIEGYVNIAEYSAGIYTLVLKDKKNYKTVRFIKK
jgi:hypothetical protein